MKKDYTTPIVDLYLLTQDMITTSNGVFDETEQEYYGSDMNWE